MHPPPPPFPQVNKSGGHAQPRYVALFTDMLMYCKFRGNTLHGGVVDLPKTDALEVCCLLPLKHLGVEQVSHCTVPLPVFHLSYLAIQTESFKCQVMSPLIQSWSLVLFMKNVTFSFSFKWIWQEVWDFNRPNLEISYLNSFRKQLIYLII